MESKEKNIEKIVLGILTFILILYISSGLIFISIFNISEKFLNKNNVTDFISSINITDILKDKLSNELTDEISGFTKIQEDLLDVGITSEGIDEFVNSEDVKNFGTDIITNLFNKVSNKSNIDYKITESQINELLENNINKLEVNASISGNQILQKIQNKIPNLVLNINEILDNLFNKLENSEEFKLYQNYIYNGVNILDYVYSIFVKVIIFFILISFILLLVFIRKSIYKSLKWLSLSFLFPSILFGILSTVIYSFVNVNNVLLNNIINLINKEIIKYFIIYIVISFIFCIINIIMYIVKKYKKKVSYE